MNCDWSPLDDALAACRRDAVPLAFWWRDDDAKAPGAALDRLELLSRHIDLPVHLAIVPAHAQQSLAASLDTDRLIPVIHGWAHRDHSGGVGKKNEFLNPRDDAIRDTAKAMAHMRSLFGAALRPMFVPPWNRINDDVTQALARQGFSALSTFGPRKSADAAIGLVRINTHIDPIWWKGTRDLMDPDQLIAQAAGHLDARRRRVEDPVEPFGLLTHHLVHTDAIWDFTATFAKRVLDGGATAWVMGNST